jgi:serine protease Do
MVFLSRPVDEGEDVFSAGFPGLGITPLWQFGRGTVSNAIARFPRSLDDETLMGPFVQHTAQVDAGNSGGPLLVVQLDASSGYEVAGMNTLSGIRRQAANYAIPVNTVTSFINSALNQDPGTYRAALDERLAEFIEGLGANRAIYPHIANFLSTICIGENAEFAVDEMFDKANVSVRRGFIEKFDDSVIGAISYAVAWTIENSIRTGGVLRGVVKEITGSGEEYTVVFTINDKDVSSTWVREYGNWRIGTFSTIAAGDRELLDQRRSQRRRAARTSLDDSVHIEAGYAFLFDFAPAALYISLDYTFYGLNFYYVNSNYWSIGMFVGYRGNFSIGESLTMMPYGRLGLDFAVIKDAEFNDYSGLPVSGYVQAGFKLSISQVPGLLFNTGFQYRLFNLSEVMKDDDWGIPKLTYELIKMGLTFSIGYAF